MTRTRNNIIKNARVLTADYLPNKLVHREGERQEIARSLQPLLEDSIPQDMLLYGPPGTGKTAMARYVVNELQKETFVESSYINCFSQNSTFEVFYELLDEKVTTPREGTSTRQLINKFEEKTRKDPVIVILDEVDQLNDDETLYEISRFDNIGLICIANDKNVFAHFEDRVISRMSGVNRIRFKRYSEEEITDILKLRKKHGLTPDSISTPQIEKLASNSGGDARVAVNTLRLAARQAEKQELEQISDDIIDESISTAYNQNRLGSLQQLNDHQKTIYQILQENGEMSMGELFDKYRTKCDEPKSKRTIRRYLGKMEAYDVIKTLGEKKGKKYSLPG